MDHIFYNRKAESYKEIVEKHTRLKINNPTRKIDYVFARGCYYYLCRTFGQMSYAKISETVNKNHATVMHSLKELPYIIKHDNVRKKVYDKIVGEVQKNYFETKTGKTLEQLVVEHNFYLMKCESYKNRLENLENKYRKLLSDNKEMKRVIYIMADTD
jgi:hypothetical protein